jgi:hypothetical protein
VLVNIAALVRVGYKAGYFGFFHLKHLIKIMACDQVGGMM